MDDINDEPALCGTLETCDESSSNGIWGEPALAAAAAADAERSRHRAWLAEQWSRTSEKTRFGVFILLCAFSGLAAILCAMLKESFGYGVLLIAVAAPVAEEMRRSAMILANHEVGENGVTVYLAVNDGVGSIFDLKILAADETQAKRIEKNFKRKAEAYYNRFITELSE